MGANTDWTEITVTTLNRRRKKLADNVTEHIPLLNLLNSKGKADPAPGGATLLEELEYAENGTFKYYSGYETLDVTPQEVFSTAEYDWKQAAVVVTISGLEEAQNSGPDRMIALLDKRISNAEKTMANNLASGIFSNGTGTGGKQIGGLQLLVADDPTTGEVGGINRANYSFWQNKIFDFSSNSLSASAATIRTAMENLWIQTTRGSDTIDTFVAGSTYFQYFWDSMTAIQRISDANSAKSGFRSLEFNGPSGMAKVIYDAQCSATRMYGLNTDYIYWRPHTDRNMVPLARRNSFNQDAIVVPIVFMGNMTLSNSSLQGVIIA